MIKRALVVLTLALLTTSVFAAETQRYLVSMRTAPRKGTFKVLSNSAEAARHRVRTFANVNAFAADLTAEEVAALKASGDVEIIAPVVERHLFTETADDVTDIVSNAAPIRYGQQQVTPWGIQAINAPAVWPVSKGSQNVNVAVIDTGIDFTHPDLKDAYAGGYNALDPTAPPLDDHRHGTHVAGTIAAADNDFGVIGVAPNVKLWAVKVLDDDGKGTDESLTAGIDWVISKAREVGGRWVVNMSLGSRKGSDIEKLAIDRAVQDNIVFVAAAGNTGMPFINYPAGYAGVIAVGAVDSTQTRAAFSTFGAGLAVVAPGVSVPSTFLGGTNTTADVSRDDVLIDASGLNGSPFNTITARLIDCGLGNPEDFPGSVRGRIAFIKRGIIPFREKARNAKNAGAVAVVVYNDEGMPEDISNWTMVFRECTLQTGCVIPPEWENYEFPLTVGARIAQGAEMKNWLNKTVTVGFRPEDYGELSGTSMATPHVAGSAAMLLSLAPELNPAQIALVLEKTAVDVAEEGFDNETAWGLIDLEAAAKYVAPAAFGLPPASVPPSKRRSGGH